jgi:hypothetical protein
MAATGVACVVSEEKAMAVKRLGYTEREAIFLAMVGLHSGAFVLRQFGKFCDIQPGAPQNVFLLRLKAKSHVEVIPSRNRTAVCLLNDEIYAALGELPAVKCRTAEALSVRLLTIDYLICHQDRRYLEGEVAKVAYFRNVKCVPVGTLPPPTTGRSSAFFAERFPIFLAGDRVGFACVGGGSLALFQTFLKRYLRLFLALGPVMLEYVAANTEEADAAEQFYQHWMEFGVGGGDFLELEAEFRERAVLEGRFERSVTSLSAAEIDRLRELRKSKANRFYRDWLALGADRLKAKLEPVEKPVIDFRAVVVPSSFDFLARDEKA